MLLFLCTFIEFNWWPEICKSSSRSRWTNTQRLVPFKDNVVCWFEFILFWFSESDATHHWWLLVIIIIIYINHIPSRRLCIMRMGGRWMSGIYVGSSSCGILCSSYLLVKDFWELQVGKKETTTRRIIICTHQRHVAAGQGVVYREKTDGRETSCDKWTMEHFFKFSSSGSITHWTFYTVLSRTFE